MRTLLKRYSGTVISMLFWGGLEVSPYQSLPLAIALWSIASLWAIVATIFWIKNRRNSISELSAEKSKDHTEHLLWKMYLNINDLIRQLREIAPLAFDATDITNRNPNQYFEDSRIKDILTKIEIEMQDCIDSDLCELFQSLMEYELWCAQFAINPIASPDIKLERIHQRIRDRIIKLIKRG